MNSKVIAISYETVRDAYGSLPLLTPMSEIAGRVNTLMSNPSNIDQAASNADLLIGAVLIPGVKAPRLVMEDTVCKMRLGSVIMDEAIDRKAQLRRSTERPRIAIRCVSNSTPCIQTWLKRLAWHAQIWRIVYRHSGGMMIP